MNIQLHEQAQVVRSNRNSIHRFFTRLTAAKPSGGALARAPSGLQIKHVVPLGKGIQYGSSDERNRGISADLGCPTSVELEDGSILTVFYSHPEQGAFGKIMQLIGPVEA